MIAVTAVIAYCWWLHAATDLVCDVVKDYYQWKASR